MTVTTPLGQVLRDDQGVRLEFVRTYDDSVEDVWSALTQPDRVARWLGTISGDPQTGTVDLTMSEDESATPAPVTILECEPPTRLVVDAPSPDGVWRLSVALHEKDGGTCLVFVQRLSEPYDASSIGPGWHYYLDRMGAVIAGDDFLDNWDDYYPSLHDAYAMPD